MIIWDDSGEPKRQAYRELVMVCVASVVLAFCVGYGLYRFLSG